MSGTSTSRPPRAAALNHAVQGCKNPLLGGPSHTVPPHSKPTPRPLATAGSLDDFVIARAPRYPSSEVEAPSEMSSSAGGAAPKRKRPVADVSNSDDEESDAPRKRTRRAGPRVKIQRVRPDGVESPEDTIEFNPDELDEMAEKDYSVSTCLLTMRADSLTALITEKECQVEIRDVSRIHIGNR
jgi:hypothetical protein